MGWSNFQAWYEKLSSHLLSRNFKVSNANHSLFVKIKGKNTTIVSVYVDNIIISGNNLENIKTTKLQLKEKFDIKDLGYLKYFLGIEVTCSNQGLSISQRKYTSDLLEETKKLGCKPISTPIDCK